MQTTAFTGIGRREPVHYMVPLPAAEARRDRLSGKIAHLYNDSFAHEFAIHQVVNCTRRGFVGCFVTLNISKSNMLAAALSICYLHHFTSSPPLSICLTRILC